MPAHKHQEAIIAWANGDTIEIYDPSICLWKTDPNPAWHVSERYRVKPKMTHLYLEVFDGAVVSWGTIYSRRCNVDILLDEKGAPYAATTAL